jgi:SpoVK/Ycf46/Vps4 family AAA+-type ATPase
MYPFVCTYNLGIGKTWGLAHIKNLVDVVYQKDAFDRLVLEPEKKKIIKSLILYKSDKFKDFIETKGNGLIFLLYGAPGTGKTLSAEATCELLEKPMYCLNVGDLGIDPEHMEIIMNTVFEYSKRWDAIICIDEVDIFLEERENNMIARNAMVGIFLKLLEYHNGIIFLTTNRLTSLDPAIKSRINLMISYKDLTSERRVTIWKSLCQKWCIDISEKTFKMLGEYKLNGREIRNYIKIIIAIHEESKEKITDQSIIKELDNCLDLSKEFDVSVNSSRIYT